LTMTTLRERPPEIFIRFYLDKEILGPSLCF
jgi:hypothetical protein